VDFEHQCLRSPFKFIFISNLASATIIWLEASFVARGSAVPVIPTWDKLTDIEKQWVWSTVDQAISIIKSRYSPEGFNIGFNFGTTAGQTVPHFHLHVIPRYAGDVADPRGGIRNVIPQRGNYLAQTLDAGADKQRLIKGDVDPFLPHMVLHMDRADTCDIAVSFLRHSGARCLLEHLKDF
jgi:diadenosine tetraphosphate (Ap4A) HIT family hydrolase